MQISPSMTTHHQSKLTMKQQEDHRSVEFMSQKELRRTYSDLILSESSSAAKDIERVECECCGIWEECTPMYIEKIRGLFCGRWVCGLCSEAVKEEGSNQRPQKQGSAEMEMEAALQSHMAVCRSFKSTTRNPQLSLASAMRDIAKKSFQQRVADAAAGDFLVLAAARTAPGNGKFRRSSFH
ncbi:hypothetical protein ZIOFF_056985 [Zingiber officinale]|uniref:Uncharacterized protein n=1 Tax=Zingiber officinale TaxID=94328 RepID=A0A8J5KPY5_ZINOF|nr:hypothetical protein ZIOFF_056985 [Zingiber officinale]